MKTNLVISVMLVACCGFVCAETTPVRIGVLTDGESDFWSGMKTAMEEAAKEQNVEIDFQIPDPATPERQNELLDEMLAAGALALAISPIDAEAQLEALKGIAAKVPVVTLFTDVPDSNRAGFMARDEKEAGRLLAQGVLRNLPPSMKVLALCKDEADVRTQARIEGMEEVFNPVDTVLDAPVADKGDRMLLKAVVKEVVTSRPEIAALIGFEAYHGPAMISAVKAADRARMIRIISFGVTPEVLEAFKEGIVHALVTDDAAAWGLLLQKTLASLARGEKEAIPEGGFIAAPLKLEQTEGGISTKEMLNEMQKQVPWISEITPAVP
jgi:ribose transport system substrate-binding protein